MYRRGKGRVLDDTRGESTIGCETSREKLTRGNVLGAKGVGLGGGGGNGLGGGGETSWIWCSLVTRGYVQMFSCNFIKYCLSVDLLRCFPELATL